MQTLPIIATDNEIKALVVEWSELVAQKEFQEALDFLPPCDIWQNWSPKELEETIAGYGSPNPHPDGVRFELTTLLSRGDKDDIIQNSIKVDRVNSFGLDPERYVGMVPYDDVPLNNQRSDLTARFHIKRVGNDRLTLEVLDIHMM